jgi:hypothetical protein
MKNDYTFQYPLDRWQPEWEDTPADRDLWRQRRFDADSEADVALIDRILEQMEECLAQAKDWGSSTLETFPGGLTAWIDPSNEGGEKPLLIRVNVSRLDP